MTTLERNTGSAEYGTSTTAQATTSMTLDADGETTADTDANGHTTNYIYDDLGRKTDTYDAMPVTNTGDQPTCNHIESDTFDLADRLLSTTDANGNTTKPGRRKALPPSFPLRTVLNTFA